MNNMFYDHIHNKTRLGILCRIRFFKFIRKFKKVMPNYDIFWQIANFVKILERIYFFDGKIDNTYEIYSSIKYKDGENGFKLSRKDLSISIKLFNDNETIEMDVDRLFGNKLKSSMAFNNTEISELNNYDMDLLNNIIDIIMNETIALLKKYYKEKVY